MTEIGQSGIMTNQQWLGYGFIQGSAPVKNYSAVKGVELIHCCPLQRLFLSPADALYGGLRSNSRAAKNLLKTATSLGNRLGHKITGSLAAFVQRSVDISQPAVFPA